MTTFNFNTRDTYRNNGQNIEQGIRYALTGKIEKADNIPSTIGTDCNGYEIKSARATLCKISADRPTENTEEGRKSRLRAIMSFKYAKAKGFIYGAKNGVAYVMDRLEAIDFFAKFSTVTRDSAKNGGSLKIRLRYETPEMIKYLEEYATRG